MDKVLQQYPITVPFTAAAAAAATLYAAYSYFSSTSSGLTPDPQDLTVLSAEKVTHNVVRLSLALPSPTGVTGLSLGQHVGVHVETPGGPQSRSYTPITPLSTPGVFDLLVKIYPSGVVSPVLGALQAGDTLAVSGPRGSWEYPADDVVHLVLLAGGSGITPVFQLLAELLDASRPERITLVYANSTPGDVILYEKILHLAQTYPEKIDLHLYVSRDDQGSWEHNVGRLDDVVLAEILPDPSQEGTFVAYCGPKGLNKVFRKALKDQGFARSQIHGF